MRFDVGVSPRVVLATAVGLSVVVYDISSTAVAAAPSKSKSNASFSVWFRAEPDEPRKKDMKAKKMNRLIGTDYDEMWMSKTRMITASDRNATGTFRGMPETTEPDNLRLPEQLPAQYQEMVRTWLVHRSACSVEYVWTDLGKSFWPRWIKTGRCGRSETMSCSWPPGMSCVPSTYKVLNLLRWHCWLKNRKSKRKNKERKNIQSVVNKTAGHEEERKRASRSLNKKNKKKQKV